MKILFYIGSFGKGGAERVIANLANSFSENNDVRIIVSRLDDIGYELKKNISIESLNPSKKTNFVIKNIIILKNIIKCVNAYKPNLIISFMNEPNMRILFFKKLGLIKSKVIISIRNDPREIYNSVFKLKIMKLLFSKADGIVFQTYEAKDFIENYIKVNGVVIPNPINDKFIVDKPYSSDRKKTIVNVGRLVEQKNQTLLIEAFAKIHNEYPNYILKIYGVGHLEKNLKNKIKELSVEKFVELKGNSDKLETELYDQGMFVLSSDYEGMPNALMEAMSLGLPCISTDCPCGGPRFLITNNENGILIDVGSVEQLYLAIKGLIENDNKSKKLGSNAIKISSKYNSKNINLMWFDFIDKIVRR